MTAHSTQDLARRLVGLAIRLDAIRNPTPTDVAEAHEVATDLRRLATIVRGQDIDPEAREYTCMLCNAGVILVGPISGQVESDGRVLCGFRCTGGFHHTSAMRITPAEMDRLIREQAVSQANKAT